MTTSVYASVVRPCSSILVLTALLLGMNPVQAQQTRTIEKTLDHPSEGEVEVIAEQGTIHVASWDRPDVEVRAEVRDWNAEDDRAPVEVEKEGATVRVKTAFADPDGAGLWTLIGLGEAEGPKMDYTICAPASVSLRVTTQEGYVEVQGMESEVTIEGYSASVAARDLTGELIAATFSGPLRAENVRGPLTFATYSGDVTVHGPTPAAEHTLASFSGDAEVVFPSDAAFDFYTDLSWGGSVTSDFPLPESAAEGDGPVSVGGGGPRLAFESFSGSISLRAEE